MPRSLGVGLRIRRMCIDAHSEQSGCLTRRTCTSTTPHLSAVSKSSWSRSMRRVGAQLLSSTCFALGTGTIAADRPILPSRAMASALVLDLLCAACG